MEHSKLGNVYTIKWVHKHCKETLRALKTGKELIRDDITYHQDWENIFCDLDLEKRNCDRVNTFNYRQFEYSKPQQEY